MAKFKKGDKVRVAYAEPADMYCGVTAGTIGTVDEDGSGCPYVKFPHTRRSMLEDQLELVEDKPKWTPGQRLNSAAEVMQALLDGERLANSAFGDEPIFLENGKTTRFISVNAYGWRIYTPPKRKVKSERWFAVAEPWGDPNDLMWSGPFLSREEAFKAYPLALDYVKAECEVEIDE